MTGHDYYAAGLGETTEEFHTRMIEVAKACSALTVSLGHEKQHRAVEGSPAVHAR